MSLSASLPFSQIPTDENGHHAAVHGFTGHKFSGASYGNSRPIASISMQLYSCTDCPYKTPSLRKLGRHKSVNHAGVKYRCELCDFVTGYQSNYYRHKKQVHSIVSPPGTGPVTRVRDISHRKTAAWRALHMPSVAPNVDVVPPVNPSNGSPTPAALDFNGHAPKSAGGLAPPPTQSTDPYGALFNFHPDAQRAFEWLFHSQAPGHYPCPKCRVEFGTQMDFAKHIVECMNDHRKSIDLGACSDTSLNGLTLGAPNPNLAAKNSTNPRCASANSKSGGDVASLLTPSSTTPSSSVGAGRAVVTPKKRPYRCSHFNCDYSADKSRDYLHHLKEAHRLSFDIFYCDRCCYAARSAHKLARHYDIVHADRVVPHSKLSARWHRHQVLRRIIRPVAENLASLDGSVKNDGDDCNFDDAIIVDCSENRGGYAIVNVEQSATAVGRAPRCTEEGHSKTTSNSTTERADVPQYKTGMKSLNEDEFDFSEMSHFQQADLDQRPQLSTDDLSNADQSKTPSRHNEGAKSADHSHWRRVHRATLNDVIALQRAGDDVIAGSSDPSHVAAAQLEDAAAIGQLDDDDVIDSNSHGSTTIDDLTDGVKLNDADGVNSNFSTKPCITETDAIELPSEQFTFDEMNDPDVKKRFCTICGYMGKWMSEMIRHKRVHTNQRPFKCKYCDRTSKWKADLIRHVSKVHGIKVISKYSRSYFMDGDQESATMVKKTQLHFVSSVDHTDGSNSDSGRGSVNPPPSSSDDADHNKPPSDNTDRVAESPNAATNDVDDQSFYEGVNGHSAADTFRSALTAHDVGVDNAYDKNAGAKAAIDGTYGVGASHGVTKGSVYEGDVNLATLLNQQRLAEFFLTAMAAGAFLPPNIDPSMTPTSKPKGCEATAATGRQKLANIGGKGSTLTGNLPSASKDPHPVGVDDCPTAMPTLASMHPQKLNDWTPAVRRSTLGESTTTSSSMAWATDVEKYAEAWRSIDGATTLRCKACRYDTRDLHTFRAHVQKHENRKPYQCSSCGYRSNWSSDVHKHIRLKKSGHDSAYVIRLNEPSTNIQTLPIKNNIASNFLTNQKMSLTVATPTNSMDSPLFAHTPSAVPSKRHPATDDADCSSPAKRRKATVNNQSKSTVVHADQSDATSRDFDESETNRKCKLCPFQCPTVNSADYAAHVKNHSCPKGIMYYKCLFCCWYSKKKAEVFQHLFLHVPQPTEQQFSDVERNLITTPSKDGATVERNSTPSDARRIDGAAVVKSAGRTGEALDLTVKRGKMSFRTGSIGEASLKHKNYGFNTEDSKYPFNEQLEIGENVKFCNEADQPMKSTNECAISESSNLAENTADDQMFDIDDSIDPEAYIHAGEVALGNEKFVFADMLPKDIQKVSALVDGQLRKMWQCRYCTHVSKRRANIRMHEKKHFKPNAIGLLKCPQCNFRGDKRALKVHYRSHAVNVQDVPASERILCRHCPASFRQEAVYGAHQAFHGGHNRYRCSQCSYAVPSQHQLTQHAHVHRMPREAETLPSEHQLPPHASSCRTSRDNVGDANSVGAERDGDDVTMNGGADTDLQTNALSNDAQRRGSKPARTLPLAREAPPLGQVLQNGPLVPKMHLKKPKNWPKPCDESTKVELIKPKKLQCRFCPAKFAERSQISRHQQFHGIKLKHQCHLCDYSVPFPINLIKHLRAHHNLNVSSVAALTPPNLAGIILKPHPDSES